MKKRKVSLLLAVILVVGSLSACGTKNTADIWEYEVSTAETESEEERREKEESKEEIEDEIEEGNKEEQKNISEDKVIELTERELEARYQCCIPYDTKCRIDLDGDGTVDEVYMDYDFDTFETLFTINDVEYSGQLDEWFFYCNSFVDVYYIVDLDSLDNYKEIALCGSGLSSDPEFHFIRFEDGTASYLGSIYTHNYELDIRGDGTIVCGGRLKVLQTWAAPFMWELQDGKINFVEQEWYYPYVNTYFYGITKQSKTLNLYESPDLGSDSITVEPTEDTINFGVTDNKEWVQFFRGDGVEGWIYLDELEGDSFENLSLYD